MKTIFSTIALFFLLTAAPVALQAQLFETVFGDLAGIEDVWDARPLTTGEHVVLANTTSFGASKILVTRLDAAGNPVAVFSLSDTDNPNHAYVGKAFDVQIDAGGNPVGLYVTGHVQNGNTRQLIFIHTDLNGNILWDRKMDNVAGNLVFQESGVAIATQPDGKVVVVGSSYESAANRYRVCAAKLDPAAMALNWCRRYTPANGESYLPAEASNGSAIIAGVNANLVAITGQFKSGNFSHTFGMAIRTGNGVEVWRKVYEADATNNPPPSQGHDIVQSAANANFLIVGQAQDAGGNQDLWVLNVNPATGAIPTANDNATYDLGGNFTKLIARDVCLNLGANGGAIAGLVEENAAGGIFRRVFFADLNFVFPANLPIRIYSMTNPNPNGSESVERINFGGNNGYLIGSTDYLTGAAAGNYDQLAIRTDPAGMHGIAACPQNTPNAVRNYTGDKVDKVPANTQETWLDFDPENVARDLSAETCDGLPLQNLTGGGGNEDRDSDTESSAHAELPAGQFATQLFPNPARGNATLRLEIGEEQPVQIAVLDLSGKLIFSQSQTLSEGRHDLSLPAADWQPGAYFVRIVSAQASQTLKLNVQR